ncbi:MAG: hypothetical protein IIY81_10280, partial [Lachnospiraceae bacterium]|nr:hypothetical protein [Lachnospiraceae bacterium]
GSLFRHDDGHRVFEKIIWDEECALSETIGLGAFIGSFLSCHLLCFCCDCFSDIRDHLYLVGFIKKSAV